MTRQQFVFVCLVIVAILLTLFALAPWAPALAVGRDFLFLGAVAFTPPALRST